MIGLIIVDDEPAIRNMISGLFDWKSLGIELVDTFSNAYSALESITSDIKIVIVDMKMPSMRGDEFIVTAKERFPWLHFIVLSGYSDFELVKKTFNAGIEDYFLKTEFDSQKFEETLVRIVDKINKEESELNENKTDLSKKMKLLKDIIYTKKVPDDLSQKIVDIQNAVIRVMVAKITQYDCVLAKYFNGDFEALHYGVFNILSEIVPETQSIIYFHNVKNEFVLIIYHKKSETVNEIINELYQKLTESFEQYLGCATNVGVSEESTKYKTIPFLYSHANLACDYSYVIGNGKLIEYDKYQETSEVLNIVELIDDVRQALNSPDFHRVVEELDYIIPEPEEVALSQTENVKKLISQIFYEVRSFVQKNNFTVDDAVFKDGEYIAVNISVTEFKKWLKNVFEALGNTVLTGNSLVNKTIKIINERYYDSTLHLNSIARELGVTYNHLSRLFKNQTKKGFNQYLSDVRMKKALYLLQNSNWKLYEISEKVGYQNYENFSRCFKAYYGTSPKKIYSNKKI